MFMFLTSDRPKKPTLAAILATLAAIYILLVNLFLMKKENSNFH